jgi:hypothetical protein
MVDPNYVVIASVDKKYLPPRKNGSPGKPRRCQFHNSATPNAQVTPKDETPKTSKVRRRSLKFWASPFVFFAWAFWELRVWALLVELGVAELRN